MGNTAACCGSAKLKKDSSSMSKYKSSSQVPLSPIKSVKRKSLANGDFDTPAGPHMAEMAYRQDTEFEMLHRLRIMFRASDINLPEPNRQCVKIEVFRKNQNGSQTRIDSTECIERQDNPCWQTPISIDYQMEVTDVYIARLVQTLPGGVSPKVIAEAQFNLTELITSKGQYIFKLLIPNQAEVN